MYSFLPPQYLQRVTRITGTAVRNRPHPEIWHRTYTLVTRIKTPPRALPKSWNSKHSFPNTQYTVVFLKEMRSYLVGAVWIPGSRLASIAPVPARLLCSPSAAPWRLRQDSRWRPSPSPHTGRLARDTRTRKARPRQTDNQGVTTYQRLHAFMVNRGMWDR